MKLYIVTLSKGIFLMICKFKMNFITKSQFFSISEVHRSRETKVITKNSWVEQREVRFSKDYSIKSDDSEGVMLLTSTVCYLNSHGTAIKNTVPFQHRKTCCTDKHT